jgi:hypothetical protein
MEHNPVAGESPNNEQDVVCKVEQNQKAGGNGIVSGQCDEGYGYDSEFQAILRHLADDTYITGFTQVQNHTIIISTRDITDGIE